MNRHLFLLALLLALALCSLAARTRAAARQLVPDPQTRRFRLVGDEPIAGPDGRSVVTDWKVLVFKDRKSSRCYVTFLRGDSMSAAGDIPCADAAAR